METCLEIAKKRTGIKSYVVNKSFLREEALLVSLKPSIVNENVFVAHIFFQLCQ